VDATKLTKNSQQQIDKRIVRMTTRSNEDFNNTKLMIGTKSLLREEQL